MREGSRMFTINDTVISVCPLIAPPVEAPGVRLEIAAASRGTVVDVRPYDYPYPYVVEFEVGEGGLVEIDVTEEQIAPLVSHAPLVADHDLPPLTVRIPERRINRQKAYTPTLGSPHYRCRLLHRINLLLLLMVYGTALDQYTRVTLLLTVVAVCLVYLHQLHVYREWAWVPQVFRRVEIPSSWRLVTHPRYLKYVLPSDVVFAVCAAASWGTHLNAVVNPHAIVMSWYVPLYAATCSMAIIALVVRTVVHHIALEIVPRQTTGEGVCG